MPEYAPPSVQLPALDDMGGVIGAIFRKLLQYTDGMLPATLIAVDDKREFATVQPQIMVMDTNDKTYSRPQYAKVPILTMGAGNFLMSFPVAPGDLGWLIASDRDISLYVQSNKESKANTNRFHSFSDGLWVPDKARQWTLADADKDKAVWQSLDGKIKVTLGTDQISLVHPTKVDVTAPLVHMTGNLTVDGTITGKTDVLGGSGNISLKTHHHTGVTTGGGNSGGPAN